MSKSVKRLVPSSTLRADILDGFYRAWELRSGPDDYFPVQQVWDEIYARHRGRLDGPVAEGAFNGLLREEFIRAIQAPDGSMAAQITDKGRSYREELLQRKRTRLLAHLGAVTGTVSLLWNVLSKILSL